MPTCRNAQETRFDIIKESSTGHPGRALARSFNVPVFHIKSRLFPFLPTKFPEYPRGNSTALRVLGDAAAAGPPKLRPLVSVPGKSHPQTSRHQESSTDTAYHFVSHFGLSIKSCPAHEAPGQMTSRLLAQEHGVRTLQPLGVLVPDRVFRPAIRAWHSPHQRTGA
jgi:hypothetical protein